MLYKESISIFWFRRDLRLHDNAGLYEALRSGNPVLPIFIFDTDILDELEEKRDKRVDLIHQVITHIQGELVKLNSSMIVLQGKPLECFERLLKHYTISSVYTNHDYEPYARQRDGQIKHFLSQKNIPFYTYKDQVIFEKDEILKNDGNPYTVFTPYSKRWKATANNFYFKAYPTEKYLQNLYKQMPQKLPSLKSLGFEKTEVVFEVPGVNPETVRGYDKTRDYPYLPEGTTRMSVHLRFGTVSIRQLAAQASKDNETLLNEYIWRDFFQMILWHIPHAVSESCKKDYDRIKWRNNEQEFLAWCNGKTGYPIVDAGMRQLNETGYMHNRVRMITASFLVKDLLIDWRWGEAYFAQKLLDYDLAANVGNWQWAAGCGCDAAPYFRVFNPYTQAKKFDPDSTYIRTWIPELGTNSYPKPIVDHDEARERCLAVYKKALNRE